MFDEVIFSYTRAEAIEDGVLVDVSEIARDVGFKYPVAITAAIESMIKRACKNNCNDRNGVLWDILWICRLNARRKAGRSFQFKVIITGLGRERYQAFKAVCGPGDSMEPVVTIMLPDED